MIYFYKTVDIIRLNIYSSPQIIVALLCGVIVLLSTFIPEAVGPANNGDFIRVIAPNRIRFIDDNPRTMWNGYGFTAEFEMSFGGGVSALRRTVYFLHIDFTTFNFPSSQIITIKISKILNLCFNIISGSPLYTYNLFWLFIIHLFIFSYALSLILGYILKRFGKKMFVYASFITIFVLCDQGYTLYFNSFYGEALQYVLTLLSIGLFLRLSDKNGKGLLPYYIVVYLMATSKFAWIPVGILFALAPLSLLLVKNMTFLHKKLIILSGTTIFALITFYSFLIPSWIEDDTNFNSVFNGVLRNSQTPENDLKWLGLDPELVILQGWEMYMYDYPIDIYSDEFRKFFFDVISKPRILLFYLNHPSRFLDILQESAEYARFIRAPYLTSVQNPKYQGQQVYRFSIWELTRINIRPLANFWFIFLIFGVSSLICIIKLNTAINRTHDNADVLIPILLIILIISTAISFVLPYVSNGISDQAKQMFGFISLFDIILFSIIGWFIYRFI